MSTYEETLLSARFAALAPEPLAGDWEDVRDRAGRARSGRRRLADVLQSRRRRPLIVLAAVVVVFVLGAASALAVRAILATQGIVGLAPAEATPSTPKNGELVLGFSFGPSWSDAGRFDVSVYADGRVIWQRLGDFSRTDDLRKSTGLLERRLTSEGVELVKAEVLATGLVDHDLLLASGEGLIYGFLDFRTADRHVRVAWGDAFTWDGVSPYVWRGPATPEEARALIRLNERLADLESWLPAGAWADSEARAYVPAGYSVCYEGAKEIGRQGVLAVLPPAAEALLRAQEVTPNEYAHLGTSVAWCSEVTNAEARALERALDDAGVRGVKSLFGLEYGVPARPRLLTATDFTLMLHPLLPDQVGTSTGGQR